MRPSAFLVITLLIISLPATAQSVFRQGFYISEANDTIYGLLKAKGKISAPDLFLFKKDDDAREEEIWAKNVKAIVLHNYRHYTTLALGDDVYYAEALAEGHASLYMRGREFYLKKNDSLQLLTIEEVKMGTSLHRKMSYIGVLKAAMSDCPQVAKSIDRTKLEENPLTSLVEKYNGCLNAPVVVYKKDIPLFTMRFNPVLAYSYSKISVDVSNALTAAFGYMEEANFSRGSFTPGMGFTISSPRVDDRYSFYFEMRYLNQSVNDRVIDSKSAYDDNDMTLSYRYLLIPFTFKYNIGINEQSSFFLKAGMIKTFKLDARFVNERRVSLYPDDPPKVEERFEFYSGQVGLVGGVGYQFRLIKKLDLVAEARWENIGPLFNSTTVGLSQDIFSFAVALSF